MSEEPLQRLAIAATAFRNSSTAPRIVAITTTTAPTTHTARTSFSIAFASRYQPDGAFELLKGLPPAPPRLWDQEAGHRLPLFRQCGDET